MISCRKRLKGNRLLFAAARWAPATAASESGTYNFPQGRVTDHRINLTLYKLDLVIDGDLDEIIDGLITADQVERLKETVDVNHG